jgi:hypothetical protein
MEYSLNDIIRGAFNDEPSKVKDAFEYLITPKIIDALEARKQEIANALFNSPQDTEEVEYDETEDNESTSENN